MPSSPEPAPRRRGLTAAAIAILALVTGARVIEAWPIVPHARAEASVARTELARALTLLHRGSPTAARDAARRAVAEQRDWGMALAVLARTELGLGDGIAAEAALDRAVKAGFDARKLVHLRADAERIQGRPDRALALLNQADPRYARMTERIRAQALFATGQGAAADAVMRQALADHPRDVDLWIAHAQMQRATGDLAGAIAASAEAVAVQPRFADALALRAEMVREQYGLIAALPWFAQAVARDPDHHDTLIEYAATLGEAGQTRAMLRTLRRAAAVRPGSAEAYYLQAVLAARAGAFDTARAVLQRAEGRLGQTPGALLLDGALDLAAGGDQQAIEKLRLLVDRQPTNIAARRLLATAHARSDASRDALAVLAPIVARADADSYSLTLAARALERIGQRGDAAVLIDRAAAAGRPSGGGFGADAPLAMLGADADRRGDAPAEIALIRGLQAGGDAVGAMRRAERLVALNPGTPAAHGLVGDLAMLSGEFGRAVDAYRRAAAIRFDEPTMLRLVEAQDRAGSRAAASRTLALFLSQNPVNLSALRLTAHWQVAAGNEDAAIDTLEAIRLRIGNRDAVVLAELAAAYGLAGEPARAAAYGRAGYALAPMNPAVVDAHGWATRNAGDAAGAVQLLARAVALAPQHPAIRWHLAQALADLGQHARAVAQARAALADPRFGDRVAAQALIARLA